MNNVDRKMALTFAHRRHAIVVERIGVKELVDLYYIQDKGYTVM